MKERGFIGSIGFYGAIAAFVVAAGLGIALKVQSSRLAAAQESLAACRATNAVLNDQITRQNEAVKSLEKAAEDRQKRAQDALEAARKGQAKAQGEIARLKAVRPTVGACPAADAVRQIREGLK